MRPALLSAVVAIYIFTSKTASNNALCSSFILKELRNALLMFLLSHLSNSEISIRIGTAVSEINHNEPTYKHKKNFFDASYVYHRVQYAFSKKLLIWNYNCVYLCRYEILFRE